MAESDSKDKGKAPSAQAADSEREQRLAKALRENLRRRKAPSPGESGPGGEGPG